MKRSFICLLLLLSLALPAAAVVENPATPTDLCDHENVRTTIYFYDSPAYTYFDPTSHKVYGPARVERVCLDCGKVLSSVEEASAEEIRPHTIRGGVCALCGWRAPAQVTAAPLWPDAPGEKTVLPSRDDAGVETITLYEQDFSSLLGQQIVTLLVRGESGRAAVALDVEEILSRLDEPGADLILEMVELEDGSLFVSLLLDAEPLLPGEEANPASLRFYAANHASFARVALTLPDQQGTLIEADGAWSEGHPPESPGFWFVPYQAEGTYILLQQ